LPPFGNRAGVKGDVGGGTWKEERRPTPERR